MNSTIAYLLLSYQASFFIAGLTFLGILAIAGGATIASFEYYKRYVKLHAIGLIAIVTAMIIIIFVWILYPPTNILFDSLTAAHKMSYCVVNSGAIYPNCSQLQIEHLTEISK